MNLFRRAHTPGDESISDLSRARLGLFDVVKFVTPLLGLAWAASAASSRIEAQATKNADQDARFVDHESRIRPIERQLVEQGAKVNAIYDVIVKGEEAKRVRDRHPR